MIAAVCRRQGYQPPVICTPLELIDEYGREQYAASFQQDPEAVFADIRIRQTNTNRSPKPITSPLASQIRISKLRRFRAERSYSLRRQCKPEPCGQHLCGKQYHGADPCPTASFAIMICSLHLAQEGVTGRSRHNSSAATARHRGRGHWYTAPPSLVHTETAANTREPGRRCRLHESSFCSPASRASGAAVPPCRPPDRPASRSTFDVRGCAHRP